MLHKESSGSGHEKAQKTAGIPPTKFNKKDARKNHRRRGFSLIELLTTVGIIGVLASVAIPAYNKYRISSNVTATAAEVDGIRKAVSACLASGGKFANATQGTATCSGTEVDGVIKPACTGAPASSPQATAIAAGAANVCYIGTNKTTDICVSAVKVTGGNWAAECHQYESDEGVWTETRGNDELGTTTGFVWCKNDGSCN